MKSRSPNAVRRRYKKAHAKKMKAYRRGKNDAKCRHCGTVEDLQYTADPFDKEINDDDKPVWICPKCYEERLYDI
jgi:hypothetical protein